MLIYHKPEAFWVILLVNLYIYNVILPVNYTHTVPNHSQFFNNNNMSKFVVILYENVHQE